MNETIKHIKARNSCRDFHSKPLTDEQVKTLVEAALAAPSARNMQPWHVSVVTDKKFIEEIDAAGVVELAAGEDKTYYDRIMERGGKILYDAPCLIVISADNSEWAHVDSGILCQNVVLAAESMGLGSCIIGLIRVALDGKNGADFKKRLMFPEGHDFVVSVLVGDVKTGKPPHDLDFKRVSHIK